MKTKRPTPSAVPANTAARAGTPKSSSASTPPTSTPSPLQPTAIPNGSKVGRTYWCYSFTPEAAFDDDYLRSAANGLAAVKHDNVGDAFLAVGAKFVGVRQVSGFNVEWRQSVFRLDVRVWLADSPEGVVVGYFAPESENHTRHGDGTETRHAPPAYAPPVPKPADPGLVEATRPKSDELTADDPPAPEVELTRSRKTGKILVFGFRLSDVVRWCAMRRWERIAVFRLLINLGQGDDLEEDVVDKWMGEINRIELTASQETALKEVVTDRKPKKK